MVPERSFASDCERKRKLAREVEFEADRKSQFKDLMRHGQHSKTT